MVAGTQPQPQPQKPLEEQFPGSVPTAQEKALKRNTDCVYFLASPLTCKKGSECEYRHSEYARVNPRDCWYWLNGICMNPKCSFRHPPLDSLLGTQAAPAAGPPLPPSQIAVTTATHAPYNSHKQAVPCIFFQKGICLKGDRCAFLHGPNFANNNKVLPVPVASLSTDPQVFKKAFGSLAKCIPDEKFPKADVMKSVSGAPETKPALKVETAPQRNVVGMERHVPDFKGFDNEAYRFKESDIPPVSNGNSFVRFTHPHQARVSDDRGFQNGKDNDEFLRESSPGFDVLVDDELRSSEYYRDDNQFGRSRGQEASNLDSLNEYDVGHSADYSVVADTDRGRFRDRQGYDSYDHMQGSYAWEQCQASSDKMLGVSATLERRGYRKSDSPETVDVSDLRHHLSKHRRVNGLRSVVSHGKSLDSHVEERKYRSSRKESSCLPLHESTLSARFRGRIKLPGRQSPVNSGDETLDRDFGRGRNRSRLSPLRPQVSSHSVRLQDRIKGMVQDDYEFKNLRGRQTRRERIDGRTTGFAGPKSLGELKVVEGSDSRERYHLGKRKKLLDNQQFEDDFPFEGPKPLSEILKKKREAGATAAASQSGRPSGNKEDCGDRETGEIILSGSDNTDVFKTKNAFLSNARENSRSHELGSDVDIFKLTHSDSPVAPNATEVASEDGNIFDETMEDQELEGDYQRDGDDDFEQDEGEYNYQEGENIDQEEEYLDDEDGDDFAKKIGVTFS
ncbi:Zinc finger CCCH domain-containing protein [Quillaja saponaria]|uniref:Zinc finger CCCH domain-containing protein n=1 Tax=Quillaja saponaria TaxID=32244 RepID=A0AAD7LAW4_QUISA|nr:Zinc finger CCCH domain-containing protein [Quillaja saponaria]